MTNYEAGYTQALNTEFKNGVWSTKPYIGCENDYQRGWNDCLVSIFNLGLTETQKRWTQRMSNKVVV